MYVQNTAQCFETALKRASKGDNNDEVERK